jgi:hypothetical protein
MTDRTDTARRYRDRAKELRGIAQDLENEEHRRILFNLADEYEEMAKNVAD